MAHLAHLFSVYLMQMLVSLEMYLGNVLVKSRLSLILNVLACLVFWHLFWQMYLSWKNVWTPLQLNTSQSTCEFRMLFSLNNMLICTCNINFIYLE